MGREEGRRITSAPAYRHIRSGFLLDDGEGAMEEGYKAALVRFQLDQIKVGKEYQQLLAEKHAQVGRWVSGWVGRSTKWIGRDGCWDRPRIWSGTHIRYDLSSGRPQLARLRQLYEADTGKALPEEETAASGGGSRGKGKGGGLTEIGREDGEDPMRAYQGLTADQLRAQVEVLLDSVASWEQRVRLRCIFMGCCLLPFVFIPLGLAPIPLTHSRSGTGDRVGRLQGGSCSANGTDEDAGMLTDGMNVNAATTTTTTRLTVETWQNNRWRARSSRWGTSWTA